MNTIPIRRGEIYHIKAGNTTTTGYEMWPERPAVIISNDVACEKAGFVNVIYLTTQKRNKKPLPTHIEVMSGDKNATALCEQIYAVDKSRIGFKIGEITEEEMKNIEKAVMFSLGISNTVKPSTIFKKWANAVERYDINAETYKNIYNPNSPQQECIISTIDYAKNDAEKDFCIDNEDIKSYCQQLYSQCQTLYQNERMLQTELNGIMRHMEKIRCAYVDEK